MPSENGLLEKSAPRRAPSQCCQDNGQERGTLSSTGGCHESDQGTHSRARAGKPCRSRSTISGKCSWPLARGCFSELLFPNQSFHCSPRGRLWVGLNELPDNTVGLSYPGKYEAGAAPIFLSPHSESLEPPQERAMGPENVGETVERWSWYMNPKSTLSVMPTLWSFFPIILPPLPTPPNNISEPKASPVLLADWLPTGVSNDPPSTQNANCKSRLLPVLTTGYKSVSHTLFGFK